MSIAYGGIIAFLFRGVNLLVALATVVVTSNQLGLDGRGTFVLGLTAIGIVNAAMGGLTAASAYQVANRRREPGAVLLGGGVVAAALSALAVATGLVLGAILSGDGGEVAVAVGAGAAAVILTSVISGVYLGNDALVRYNIALVAPPLMALAAIVVVVVVLGHESATAALAAYAAGQWITIPFLLALGAARMVRGVRFDRGVAIAILRFAAIAGISSGVSFLNYRADVLVVDHFEGKDGVAIYANAVYIGESVWQLSGSLALATFARVGSLDRVGAAQLTTRVMRHTLVILGFVCLLLFVLADVIVGLLFDPEFAGSASALRYLLPGTWIYGLAASYSAFYTYQRGMPWVAAVLSGAGLVVDIALDFILIPRMGVDGAALASAIAYGGAMSAALVAFVRREHIRPTAVFRFGPADVQDYRVLLGRLRSAVGR